MADDTLAHRRAEMRLAKIFSSIASDLVQGEVKSTRKQNLLIRAKSCTPQLVTCGVVDHLVKNFVVPVVFFYEQGCSKCLLTDSLAEALSAFPIFAGRLKLVGEKLSIDCANQGVPLTFSESTSTLDEILHDLPHLKNDVLVDMIQAKKALSGRQSVLTVKVISYADGGLSLGLCWHHSIGDMDTFMHFMKTWSEHAASGCGPEDPPMIVGDRDRYLLEKLRDNGNNVSAVRKLGKLEILAFFWKLIRQMRSIRVVRLYFSPDELLLMKQQCLDQGAIGVSTNDALCAHIAQVLGALAGNSAPRRLSVIVNYRSREDLPLTLTGNHTSFLTVAMKEGEPGFALAKRLRESIDRFASLHMDYLSTYAYIQANGGLKKAGRFFGSSIDPKLPPALIVTSWCGFGTDEVSFGASPPLYFTPLVSTPIPYTSVVSEGVEGKGRLFTIVLLKKTCDAMKLPHHLAALHRYRNPEASDGQELPRPQWML